MGGSQRPTLIIITGPTASGKSSLALELADFLGTEIVSADSRQMFADIPIGTAAPTIEELQRVKHHFVGNLSLDAYYSAASFEEDVLKLLPDIFERCNGVAVMCGGSMMYVDAVVKGIDKLPTISEEIRSRVKDFYATEGLEASLAWLSNLDPEYYAIVDKANPRRVVHAIEICLQSGQKYSSMRTGAVVERPFDIIKFAIDWSREQLFDRINTRVDAMIADGFIEEARRVYPFRNLNSLNTVGYKELFTHFDGIWDLPTAVARIAKNTRVYAKKQLTWLANDNSISYLNPTSPTPLLNQVLEQLQKIFKT